MHRWWKLSLPKKNEMLKFVVLKLINLAALLASVAWLTSSPDWDSIITFLVLLTAFLGQEYWPSRLRRSKDKRLFEKFLGEFPSSGACANFLKEQDIGAPFRSEVLRDLDHFINTWYSAEHEFLDRKIERQKTNLLNAATKFREKLAVNTYSAGNGYLTMDLKDLEDRPEILKLRNELNEMATLVYQEHQKLIRMCSKKL